ncbi:MAG TPA: DUF4124 domain-containing protein [Burkholderiales bacterium]|nr:DUF4124 domain-containing protein [Burkholderiales bacterium]
MKIFCALLLSLMALPALAQQPVYRSVMPDGRIIYGDKPAPGAAKSEQVQLPPLNTIAPPENGGEQAAPPAPQPTDEADAEIANARQALQQAKAALDAGREPQPEERIGKVGGGTRLTDAYFERIRGLENAVTAAQQRLDAALAARNTLR